MYAGGKDTEGGEDGPDSADMEGDSSSMYFDISCITQESTGA